MDSVTAACSQICVHLSEPLFELVLNMVYDYASTNVRPNAVRAVHQLVECVANAIARGNPSLKQVGFAWIGTLKRGRVFWEVLRPGDKKGGSDEVRWQTLVVMDEFKEHNAEFQFWASTKEKGEKLRPGVGMT